MTGATLKIGTVEADITADTSGLKRAEQQFTSTGKKLETSMDRAGQKVSQQFRRIESDARNTTVAFRPMKGAIQQASFQVQDFAVQVGSGTNALRAFSQQAPQFLSVFGAGGAVLGTIVGIATAIGASLVPSLFDAADAMETLEQATEELDEIMKRAADTGGVNLLTEKIIELAKVSKAAALTEIRGGIITALDQLRVAGDAASDSVREVFSGAVFARGRAQPAAITNLAEELGIARTDVLALRDAIRVMEEDASATNIQAVQDILDQLVTTTETATPELVKLANQFRDVSATATAAQTRLDDLREAEADLPAAIDAATEAYTRENRQRQERIRLAKEEAAARREAREQARIETKITGIERLNEGELERINREARERREFVLAQEQLTADQQLELLREIRERRITETNAFNDRLLETERQAQEKRANQEEAAAERQAQTQAAQQTAALAGLSALGDRANDILRQTGQEGSAIAKAIFLTQKAIQVAQIIAATEVAAANAAALAAAGGVVPFFATQGVIRATGYASAALVAGLAVGQTFGGGRAFGGNTSGMLAHPINERGTPEILNMKGKQYLLPTGQGGRIEPMRGGASGGPKRVIVQNLGPPMEIVGERWTEEEIILIADSRARAAEGRIHQDLSTGTGDTSTALRTGFQVPRRIGS